MADHDDVVTARISRMPKAEIHVHLEGATAAATYFEIAKRNGIELATADLPQWNDYFKFRDFNHFIEVYVGCTKFLRTADDYALLVRRFGEQQAALNIKYTETFVSCSLLPAHIDRSAFLDAIRGAAVAAVAGAIRPARGRHPAAPSQTGSSASASSAARRSPGPTPTPPPASSPDPP